MGLLAKYVLRKTGHAALLVALLGACSASIYAQESDLSVGGYGTLGYQWDNRKDLGLRRGTGETEDSGRQGSWRPDTRFGIQASYRVNQQFEIAAQAGLRDRGDGYRARPEWAFATWHGGDTWDLRLGRLPLDLYLMSDHLNIGYSYPWVRPVSEFYGVFPLQHLEGFDVSWKHADETGLWRLKLQTGRTAATFRYAALSDPELKADSTYSIIINRESGPWRFRASHTRARVHTPTPDAAQLAPLVAIANAALPGISSDMMRALPILTGDSTVQATYIGLGVAYDDGLWLLQGELSDLDMPTQFPAGMHSYLSLGRRYGDVMPYVAVAGVAAKAPFRLHSDWSALPGGNNLRDGLVGQINTLRQSSSTLSLGIRWDFHSQAALKLQWDHSHIDAYGYAPWAVTPAQQARPVNVNVLTTTFDFVF